MNIHAHVESLERKHAVLENLIELENGRPLPDFSRVTRLKKQKLLIREELENFMNSPQAA